MADRKYLQLRRGTFYLRVPRPPQEWGTGTAPKGNRPRELVFSLGTSDLQTARAIRNRYLIPLLSATKAQEFVSELARLAAAADEDVARRLREVAALRGLVERVSLRTATDQWLEYLRAAGGHSPATLVQYKSTMDAICTRLGPDTDLEQLTKADAVRLRDELLTKTNGNRRVLNPRTAGRMLSTFRTCWRWLRDNGKVRAECPFEGVDVGRMKVKHKRPPTDKEADQLCAMPCPANADPWTWRMMPLIARHSGMRAGEVTDLTAESICEVEGVLSFDLRERDLKTGSSSRVVPVATALREPLSALLAERPVGPLFQAQPLKHQRAHGFLRAWQRAAMKVVPDATFHAWRVRAQDKMLSAGVGETDAAMILGHSVPGTQRAYNPPNLRRWLAAVDQIG